MFVNERKHLRTVHQPALKKAPLRLLNPAHQNEVADLPERPDSGVSLALRVHVSTMDSTEYWTSGHNLWPVSGLCLSVLMSGSLSLVSLGLHWVPGLLSQLKVRTWSASSQSRFPFNSISTYIKQPDLLYFHFLTLPLLRILHFENPDLPTSHNPLESDTANMLHSQCKQKPISFFHHLKST